jgi:hypothetical protein
MGRGHKLLFLITSLAFTTSNIFMANSGRIITGDDVRWIMECDICILNEWYCILFCHSYNYSHCNQFLSVPVSTTRSFCFWKNIKLGGKRFSILFNLVFSFYKWNNWSLIKNTLKVIRLISLMRKTLVCKFYIVIYFFRQFFNFLFHDESRSRLVLIYFLLYEVSAAHSYLPISSVNLYKMLLKWALYL